MSKSTFLEYFGKYKAVLFDVDGVLINSDQAWIIALQKVLTDENWKVPSVKLIEENLALSTIGQIRKFFPEKSSDPLLLEEIAKKVDQYYLDHIAENVLPDKNSVKILNRIKQLGIKLGVVTNNGGVVTESILKTFELFEYFDSIMHLDIMEQPKPDPSALLDSIDRFDVEKKDTLFIGDSPSDLEASVRAGIDLILVKNPNSSFIFPKIPKQVKVVSKLEELL